ncbi:glycoside hydrolase [Candidatus Nomurabacteria bacterium]|nr:glycoside hydrolase [Candidatus Nomurabacteria bacterium]
MRHYLNDFISRDNRSDLYTDVFQSAIDKICYMGGGTLVIPSGIYTIGSVRLRSNLTIHFESGATILGSTDMGDYKESGFTNNALGEAVSLLYAVGESNIHLEGNGVICFQGSRFFTEEIADDGFSSEKRSASEIEETILAIHDRPNQPILFHDCQNISLSGLVLEDAPHWTLTISCCKAVKVRDLTIDNNLRVPNCDGIHITSSSEVQIYGCNISSADDCIAITGITDWDRLCQNISVSNCILRSRSAAVRCGYSMSKVRNVLLSDLLIHQTNRGFGIFAEEGGFVEDVIVRCVVVQTRLFAGHWWGNGETVMISSSDKGGTIRRIRFSDIIAESANGVVVAGFGNAGDLVFEGIQMSIKRDPERIKYDKGLDLAPLPIIDRPDTGDPAKFIDRAEVRFIDFFISQQ